MEFDDIKIYLGFNTASGKYCCNVDKFGVVKDEDISVSIPQAVSTVATKGCRICKRTWSVSIPQAVSTVATETCSGCTYL